MSEPREPDVARIYERMGRAIRRGQGMRLSADELEHLVLMDDALGQACANMNGADSVGDLIDARK